VGHWRLIWSKLLLLILQIASQKYFVCNDLLFIFCLQPTRWYSNSIDNCHSVTHRACIRLYLLLYYRSEGHSALLEKLFWKHRCSGELIWIKISNQMLIKLFASLSFFLFGWLVLWGLRNSRPIFVGLRVKQQFSITKTCSKCKLRNNWNIHSMISLASFQWSTVKLSAFPKWHQSKSCFFSNVREWWWHQFAVFRWSSN